MKIALISCCKTKLNIPAKAMDLYTGDSFKKIRQYSEINYHGWAILSALLGLVSTDEIIEPYEFTLIGKSKMQKQSWANSIFAQIILQYKPGEDELFIFAGRDYRDHLMPLLEQAGFSVTVPLKGLGIGQQKAWMLKELNMPR